MKQLILPNEYMGEELYSLPSSDSHYLIKVQRKEIGFNLNLLDRKGTKYCGTIVDIQNDICILKLAIVEQDIKEKRKIYLFQSIPKGKKIDLMIRQAVEIGVDKIFPIMADHSVPQFKTDQEKSKKRERWQKIVKEASQQSGTDRLTTIENLTTMDKALESVRERYTGLFFHQVPLENKKMHNTLSEPEDTIIIVIGPEGGISHREVELLKNYGFTATLLGDNILRAETATTFALGAVKMMLLERDIWKTV